MEHLFAPYEIAVMAKENGFNDSCLAYYYTNIDKNNLPEKDYRKNLNGLSYHETAEGEFEPNFIINNSQKDYYVSAPTHQQLIDWFRDKHNLTIYISNAENKIDKWDFRIMSTILSEENNIDMDSELYYPTYYEALNAALIKAFKLIPKTK